MNGCSGPLAGDCPLDILVRNDGFTAEHRDQRFIDIAAVDPVASVHKTVVDEFAGFHINQCGLPVPLLFSAINEISHNRINRLGERRTGFVDWDVR